jgi:transposase
MQLYNNYVGIDIGKTFFVVAVHGERKTYQYANDAEGINRFSKDLKKRKNPLCILETTGGYEMRLLLGLCELGIATHRAHAGKVKHFIQSYGNKGKTDQLDAASLALYGYERGERLELFTAPTGSALALFELVQRRNDLRQMLISEKNRLKGPRSDLMQSSYKEMIEVLNRQMKAVTEEINKIIESDSTLKSKKAVLKTIPGIGDIVASELLVLLPELGALTRRQIASLSGLAPKANDSGQFRGYRSIGNGRCGIKPILFLSAMAARNSNSNLKAFYNNLLANGKKKMVALTALMRKIIVIANARIRDFNSANMCRMS